jgi:type II secretory pathway component PulF
MPIFQYLYLDARNRKKQNLMYGNCEKNVRAQLLQQQVKLLYLKQYSTTAHAKKLRSSEVQYFFDQLGSLLEAHIPLLEALSLLESQAKKPRVCNTIASIRCMVASGHSLAFSLKEFPSSFPKEYIAIVESGEKSCSLNEAIRKLRDLLEWKTKTYKKITQALIYPGFLLTFATLVLFLILFFVIPSIEELFEDNPSQGFSTYIFSLSHFLRSHLFSISTILFSAALFVLFQTKRCMMLFKRALEKIPLIRIFNENLDLLIMSKVMHLLLQNGISLYQSLQLVRQAVRSADLQADLHKICSCVNQGISLTQAFKEASSIPQLYTDIIQVGESSSNLEQAFLNCCTHYEKHVHDAVAKIQTYAQPILIIGIGCIIGIVMLAIFVPLSDVSTMNI